MKIDEKAYWKLISLCEKVKRENDYLASKISSLEHKVRIIKEDVNSEFETALCLMVLNGGRA